MTHKALEIIVKFGMITSSPFFMPRALIAISNAAVPLETEVAFLRPINFEKLSSKSSIYLPAEETHPVLAV